MLGIVQVISFTANVVKNILLLEKLLKIVRKYFIGQKNYQRLEKLQRVNIKKNMEMLGIGMVIGYTTNQLENS